MRRIRICLAFSLPVVLFAFSSPLQSSQIQLALDVVSCKQQDGQCSLSRVTGGSKRIQLKSPISSCLASFILLYWTLISHTHTPGVSAFSGEQSQILKLHLRIHPEHFHLDDILSIFSPRGKKRLLSFVHLCEVTFH